MACVTHSNKYLERKEHKKTYHCDGCKMNGKGQGHACDECDYVLHSQCMFPSYKLRPSFLPGDTFQFMEEPLPPPTPTGKRYCDACGVAVKGFAYHCFATGFDLHPCCASLHTHVEIGGQRLFLKKERVPKRCDLCVGSSNKKSDRMESGWFYASESADCKCHVFCIMNMGSNVDAGLAVTKLESLALVKKKRYGKNGNKYWKIVKTIVRYVLAAIMGDPTTIVAKILVDGVVQLADFL